MTPEELIDLSAELPADELVADEQQSELPRGMTDEELAELIDRECADAVGLTDELSAEAAENMQYYLGEKVGNLAPPEVEGRSKVVSRDVLDTVEWIMPTLMRMFAGSEDVIRFEPDSPEEEGAAEDATRYVNYLIYRRNKGFLLLHDAIKSALISRRGVIKCYPDFRWDVREESYNGLSDIEREQLLADPELELLSETSTQGPDGNMSYDMLFRRKRKVPVLRAEGVPPEEIRIARDARSIEDVRFIAHVRDDLTLSDLKSMGYPAELVDALAHDDSLLEGAPERVARENYDGTWEQARDPMDPSQRKVTLVDAYLRVDYDGDGIAEYRRVVKSGTTVFENHVTDDHPFALFCPILMPYKVIGLSVADLVKDLQEIKTALIRQVLDNVYLANTPMRAVVDGQVNLDDLLEPRPGGFVRVKQLDAIRDLAVPFVGGAGLTLIKHFDEVQQKRTGVSEPNQGLHPDSLAKSNVGSMGIEALLNAGMQRIELIARVFAETGITRLYLLMLKLAQQNIDRPQQVKINGRWMTLNPRAWRTRYDTTVSVGIGTASRQQQVQNLQLILQLIERVAPYGLAGPMQAYKALSRLAEAMGYRDVDQFFTPPQPGMPPAPQQGQQDDSQAAAQALIVAEQIKAQAAQQRAQLENNVKLMIAQMQIQSDERIAQMKAETDLIKQHIAKFADSLDEIKQALGLVKIGGVQ